MAEFVGLSNRFPGHVKDDGVDVLDTRLPLMNASSVSSGPVTVLVRPESVEVTADPTGAGRVVAVSFLGPLARVTVALPGDTLVVAQVSSARLADLPLGTGVRVSLLPVPVVVSADSREAVPSD